jgi:hypothetical protein
VRNVVHQTKFSKLLDLEKSFSNSCVNFLCKQCEIHAWKIDLVKVAFTA